MRQIVGFFLMLAAANAASAAATVERRVRDAAHRAPVEVLIRLTPAPRARAMPLSRGTGGFGARVGAVVSVLRAHADGSQRALLDGLAARGIRARSWWVVNALQATVDATDLEWLAQQPEVLSIVANRRLQLDSPVSGEPAPSAANAIEWGVQRVRAPEVWALGNIGQEIVIAGQDTGYRWDHAALRNAYRGWNGTQASHDHHWHDAITSASTGSCGANSPQPCDDNGHGTHTMGTMLGDDDAANQIGVAPGARWIGCRNMDQGNGTVATYLDCFQWFLAPTDLAGNDPQPALAPHIINNSWGCPPSEGCNDIAVFDEAIDNVLAAGIFMVVSAGNAGSGCATIIDPPATHPDVFVVGATTSLDAIASFSSRGPVTTAGGIHLKPDVAAPGASIRSSLDNGGYGNKSGTSMAAPHVAGIAALMMRANPTLIGDPAGVAEILRATAVATVSAQTCGTFSGAQVPNAVFGSGRVDALAAVQAAIALLPVELFGDGFEVAPAPPGAPALR